MQSPSLLVQVVLAVRLAETMEATAEIRLRRQTIIHMLEAAVEVLLVLVLALEELVQFRVRREDAGKGLSMVSFLHTVHPAAATVAELIIMETLLQH
jgi:hypothetical protein